MDLKQLIAQFIELSGRADLNPSYAQHNKPTGSLTARDHINAGISILDGFGIDRTRVYQYIQIAEGQVNKHIAFPRVRILHSLAYRSGRNECWTDLDITHVKPEPVVSSPDLLSVSIVDSLGEHIDAAPAKVAGHYLKLYMPAAPAGFYRAESIASLMLYNDEDSNWWAENYPMLVVWAACYSVEVSYRNTQGANDWYGAIKEQLSQLQTDHAVENSPTDYIF